MNLRPSRIAWALVAATALSWASPRRTHAQEDLTELEETALRAAVDRVAPSVVRIETLGGLEAADGMLVGTGPSTGVAVSEDGYILSSAFHFVQRPPSILVTLPQGNRVAARIVARDHGRQLVLLKVETDQRLTVPEIVPRSELEVGQWTIAVGHTYANNVPNRSVGILSATSRMWGRAVQTDANVSPANYGGPLIDVRGRVIGILVPMAPDGQSELAGAEWYDSGIGFAIPLADLMNRLDAMKQGTDLHPGLLGVSLKGTDIYALPATIAACPAKSPARQAGLQVGDTIVEINGVAIRRQAQLRHALGPLLAGDTVRVVATRGDQQTRALRPRSNWSPNWSRTCDRSWGFCRCAAPHQLNRAIPPVPGRSSDTCSRTAPPRRPAWRKETASPRSTTRPSRAPKLSATTSPAASPASA